MADIACLINSVKNQSLARHKLLVYQIRMYESGVKYTHAYIGSQFSAMHDFACYKITFCQRYLYK